MSLARKICLALGCIVLTASACLAVNPKQAIPVALRPHGSANDQDEPEEYGPWIDSAIAKIGGDDANEQRHAADLLAITVADPSVRPKVLAALEPHLNSSDQSFRLKCVTAFGHWATKDQIKQLEQVVATPESPKPISGAEACWRRAAITAMVTLDPEAAKTAMQSRLGSFFLRDSLSTQLQPLTLDDSPALPEEFAMLKQVAPDHVAVQTSVADAIALVKSDSASDRTKGANALAHSLVSANQRSEVIDALRSHLTASSSSNGRTRQPFVQAFSHWAGPEDVAALKQVVATPDKVGRGNGDEDCWAAAIMGLARLDPQAAADAAKTRIGTGFFNFNVHHLLEPIAQGNGPDSSVACWLIGLVDPQMAQPRLPQNFNPAPPNKLAVPSGQAA